MDAVSYSLGAKQAVRIKKFVAEPDATSGLVTVPSVIATGETVSIPAGRTLVHPNLQVDGTLVVDGTLFIPSGGSASTTLIDATVVKQDGNVVANDSKVVHKTGDTMTGNLVMGSGTKIQGDFSNSPFSNRTLFQTNITNGATQLGIIPNGTSSNSMLRHYGSYDANNTSSLDTAVSIGLGQTYLASDKTGTGTYLPMTFYTGGAERLRIDTSGNVLVTGSGGLGYGTGSGGTVTQLTSKDTSVTLNKPTGRVVTNNSSLAGGASIQFTLNNSLISITDTVYVCMAETGSALSAYDFRTMASHGYCYIYITNKSGITQSDAIGLNFIVFKGAVS